MNTRNLHSGVDTHIIDAPKFKTNLISVYLNIPLKRETVTYAALLPSVLKRGCIKYPTIKDMSRRLEDMYGATFSAGTRNKGDGIVLYFSSGYISDKFIGEKLTRDIAEFIRDFIFSPLTEDNGFLPQFVSSEKVNLKNAILGLINDKKEYAEFKCRESMFGQDGYGICDIGYAEDLDDINPKNLYEYYKSVLDTAKVDIFVSGTVDEEVVKTVEDVIGSAFSAREADYIKSETVMPRGEEIRTVVENANVVQSKLCMGLRCGVDVVSDEYYALMLASCIFGGSPFSKLFNNVREKLSLAYYAIAKTTRFKSVMMISSGIQTENYQAAYDEIMVQFNKMKDGEISDEEMEASKKYLNNSLCSLNDGLRSMEDYYLSQAIMGTEQSIEELIAELNKVDKKRVCDVMKKMEFDTVYFLKGRTAEEGEE